jgi:hypothetical protein
VPASVNGTATAPWCRWAVRVLLVVLVGCAAHPVAVPPPPVVAEPPAKPRWVTPAACVMTDPIPVVACPPEPPPDPAACTIERVDLASGTTVDRYEYVGDRLTRHDTVVSDVETDATYVDYDARGRRVRETYCMRSQGGKAGWFPSWREPMVERDTTTTLARRTELAYTGEETQPASATIVYAEQSAGAPYASEQRICYTRDAAERRLQRWEVSRFAAGSATAIRSYAYAGDQLRGTTFGALVDRGGDIGVRHQLHYSVTYAYDAHGRMTERRTDYPSNRVGLGGVERYRYDDRGRVTMAGSFPIEWDGDRIRTLGGTQTFRYSGSGRLDEARYAGGDGYRIVYGARCPATLRPYEIQPTADPWLYYEGKHAL